MEHFKKFTNISNLCRTCLGEEKNLKKIHDTKITIENNSETVLQLLNFLTKIQLNKGWPDNICGICIEKLMQVYMFKLQCDNSNKLFEEYLNSVKTEDSHLSDAKGEINEIKSIQDDNTMFAITKKTSNLFVDIEENIVRNKLDESRYWNAVKTEDSEQSDVKSEINKIHTTQDEHTMLSFADKSPNSFEDTGENETNLNKEISEVIDEEENGQKNISEQERFCCIVCGNNFKSRKLLNSHKKAHGQYLQCLLCNENFSSEIELKEHKNKDHSENPKDIDRESVGNEEIANLSCTKCKKTFKSKYSLLVHEKRHIYEGHFLCTFCGKGFNAQGCLNRHIRVHTGEKKYECSVCNKKFPSSNNLNLHFRIHSGEKPYLCTVCGKSFSHPTGLTYHLRTHTKERKYKCNFCAKAFSMQCHLDNHTKIHTGERPHACKQCNRAFIKKIDLQRHELTHTGVKPHVCTVCDKDFLRPLHLNYHMMIHTAERPHRCSYCGKGFIRRYYLKDHMLKHHGIEETKKAEDMDDTETDVKEERKVNAS